jgi:hypothetical protein
MFPAIRLVRSSVVHTGAIKQCAYCGQTAVLQIPSTPGDVCQAHAIEYWTDLMAFVKGRSGHEPAPNAPCRCWTCNQLSELARATAADEAPGSIVVVGPRLLAPSR